MLHIGVVLLEFISPVRKQRYLTQPSHTVPRFSKAAFSPHGLSSRQAYIVALLSPAADTPLAAAVKFLRSGNLWNRFVVMKKDGRICPLTRFCQTFTQSFFIFLCGGADKRHICCGPPRNRGKTKLAFLRHAGRSYSKCSVSHHRGDGKSVWPEPVRVS